MPRIRASAIATRIHNTAWLCARRKHTYINKCLLTSRSGTTYVRTTPRRHTVRGEAFLLLHLSFWVPNLSKSNLLIQHAVQFNEGHLLEMPLRHHAVTPAWLKSPTRSSPSLRRISSSPASIAATPPDIPNVQVREDGLACRAVGPEHIFLHRLTRLHQQLRHVRTPSRLLARSPP